MIKIRVTYETDEELERLKEKMGQDAIRRLKIVQRKGEYKKAYMEIKTVEIWEKSGYT